MCGYWNMDSNPRMETNDWGAPHAHTHSYTRVCACHLGDKRRRQWSENLLKRENGKKKSYNISIY